MYQPPDTSAASMEVGQAGGVSMPGAGGRFHEGLIQSSGMPPPTFSYLFVLCPLGGTSPLWEEPSSTNEVPSGSMLALFAFRLLWLDYPRYCVASRT